METSFKNCFNATTSRTSKSKEQFISSFGFVCLEQGFPTCGMRPQVQDGFNGAIV
jgi:hypothetical protein